MAKVETRTKVKLPTIKDKNVIDMFNGVLGTSETNVPLRIAFPKFKRVEHHAIRFMTVLDGLAGSKTLSQFDNERALLSQYLGTLRGDVKEAFDAPNLVEFTSEKGKKIPVEALDALSYDNTPPEVCEKFSAAYEALMGRKAVSDILNTCKLLAPKKKKLAVFDLSFVTKDAGGLFTPLAGLPAFNFKNILVFGADRIGDEDKKFIATVLNKLYTVSHDLFEAISAPDFSVDEFVETVRSQVGELKKVVPRCDDAIGRIVESTTLLKDNFNTYWREQVMTGSNFVIMENYIHDISKQTTGKGSGKIKMQFAQIIKYYKGIAAKGTTDPKLQALFGSVDKHFSDLGEAEKEGEDDGEGDGAIEAKLETKLETKLEAKGVAKSSSTNANGVAPAGSQSHADKQKAKKNKRKNAARRKKGAAQVSAPPS